MIITTWMSMMVIMIGLLMITINTMISKKTFSDREKSSPFECGFDPKNKAQTPFSMHFFMITVMTFLIFDVEITLLVPMIYTLTLSNLKTFSIMFSFFILILLVGIFDKWNQGALSLTN